VHSFAFSQKDSLCVQGSIHSLFLYDAVYLHMTMMEQIVSEGNDWRNGTFWRNMARNWVTRGQHLFHAVWLTMHMLVKETSRGPAKM